MQYAAQPGAQVTSVITVFGKLKREWADRSESLEIKATLHYLETVTKADGINVELECRLRGQGQAGNGGGATSSPLDLKWLVKMKRSGRDVQIPTLEKQEFPQIPELAVLLLFNETTRLLAFADRPVQEREGWTSRLELKTRNATIPVEVSSKFVGRRTHRGYGCAVIESAFEGQLDLARVQLGEASVAMKGEQEGELTTLFALEEGQVVRSEGHVGIELHPETPEEKSDQEGEKGEKPAADEKPADVPETIRLEFQFVRELQTLVGA
jgi:hypothetical protein